MRSARHAAAGNAVSLAGFAAHNVAEFGWRGLYALDAGFLPMAALQLAALARWPRRGATWALLALAALHLVAGAVLSVLPLRILPFAPEQTPSHYAAHVAYGVAQVPLLVVAARRAREA